MTKPTLTPLPDPSGFSPDPLTDILRSGARRLIEQAVEAELTALLAAQTACVERVIRTLKEQCVHRQCFDDNQHATRAIADWISFYNNRRPHQALAMRTPAEAFRLAA